MNILLASAEVEPFAKAGGLADVAAVLPAEWQKFGQNPIIVMPKYSFIDTEYWDFKPTQLTLYIPIGDTIEFAHLWYGTLPGTHVPVYLVEYNDYFNRAGIYGDPNEYPDNDRRFIFFSRSVLEVAKALNFTPDVIHAHDYHTAFALAFLKSQYRHDYRFARTAGVYTIHNLAYQGHFDPVRAMTLSGFGMSQFYPGSWFEHYGTVNSMKVGIMFADKITTVSPTYAKEIRMPYYSEGLQDVLNQRGGDLIGILNGVNYKEWSPEEDEYLYEKYSSYNLYGKLDNKYSFLRDNGITNGDGLDLPLFGMVTRLTEQKGIDLLINKLEYYLENNILRFALLGSGESQYEDFFNGLKSKYPRAAFINIGYNNTMAHRIIACSDFLLLPSRFEPCGLTQMYALRYGTIPIVRSTGGLADTVIEYIPDTGDGNGLLFYSYNADDFVYAIRRALSIYMVNTHWDLIRRNAMKANLSSSQAALEYLKVFKWALGKVK